MYVEFILETTVISSNRFILIGSVKEEEKKTNHHTETSMIWIVDTETAFTDYLMES